MHQPHLNHSIHTAQLIHKVLSRVRGREQSKSSRQRRLWNTSFNYIPSKSLKQLSSCKINKQISFSQFPLIYKARICSKLYNVIVFLCASYPAPAYSLICCWLSIKFIFQIKGLWISFVQINTHQAGLKHLMAVTADPELVNIWEYLMCRKFTIFFDLH